MNKVLIILLVLVLINKLSAQTGDSLALKNKNQKQIEQLRNRITNIENTELRFKHLLDSIAVLNGIIRDLTEKKLNPPNDSPKEECVRLFYKSSQTKLNYTVFKELDSIANVCLNNPKMKIKLVGYADKWGSSKFNVQVSKERTIAIKNYLTSIKKIPAENIQTDWKGSRLSSIENSLPQKQFLNRRVEVCMTAPKE